MKKVFFLLFIFFNSCSIILLSQIPPKPCDAAKIWKRGDGGPKKGKILVGAKIWDVYNDLDKGYFYWVIPVVDLKKATDLGYGQMDEHANYGELPIIWKIRAITDKDQDKFHAKIFVYENFYSKVNPPKIKEGMTPSLLTRNNGEDCDDNDVLIKGAYFIILDTDKDAHIIGFKGWCSPVKDIPLFWDFFGYIIVPGPGGDARNSLESTGLMFGDCDDENGNVWRMACVSTPIPGKPKQWTNAGMCVGDNPPPGSWFCKDGSPTAPELFYTVYPNPVSDKLNISPTANWTERAEIKLIDQYARAVRTLQVPNAVKGQTFTINTSDLKPGLYQLTIRRGDMIESKTIAVKL